MSMRVFFALLLLLLALAGCASDENADVLPAPGGGSGGAFTGIVLTELYGSEKFSRAVAFVAGPGNARYVVEQPGRIRRLLDGQAATDFADIRARVSYGGEAGLLGMAFDPAFASNGRVYLSYTRNGDQWSAIGD